jgi:GAF domain-containing protein
VADDRLHAAVAAGVLGSEEEFGRLLRSIVQVARAIFGAKGSSIFLLDEETDELVFAAVANEDEQFLVGRRMPSSQGVAGWVASSRTPLVLEDVTSDPRHARDFAAGTGYVPKGLMAVPLLEEERVLGVLQVLDRPQQTRFSLQEMELLGLFGSQAAIALSLLQTARSARKALTADGRSSLVAELAGALERLEDDRREAADALLQSLVSLLDDARSSSFESF